MKQGNKLAGANPSRGRVENDFYATHPDSVKALLAVEEIIYPALEPACGEGHIAKLLKEETQQRKWHKEDGAFVSNDPTPIVVASDLVDRGYGEGGKDFLLEYEQGQFATVITNPPFNLFTEFVRRGLEIATHKLILFGKLQALEGQHRASYIQNTPLRTVYVFKKRQQPLRNGKETDDGGKKLSSTMAFAWFVWEKGYDGKPTIQWI